MTKCKKGCSEKDLLPYGSKVTREVDGIAFMGRLSSLRCSRCGQEYLDGPSLIAFDEAVALKLASAGRNSGGVLRFLRKAMGISARDMAELLGVRVATISDWETGKASVPLQAMALLDSMVQEKAAGRSLVFDNLRALRNPKRLPKRIKIDVGDSAPAIA